MDDFDDPSVHGESTIVPEPNVDQNGYQSGSKLVTNSFWNLAAYVIATAIGIVSVPLYVHFLGVAHYGLMVLLNSILAPVSLLDLGFGKATIKYVAESVGRKNPEEAGTYIRTTLLFNIGVGVIGMLVIAALAGLLTQRVFRIDSADLELARLAIYWVAFGWLITQIATTYQNVPAAFQRFNIVAIGSSASLSIGILVGLLVLAFGGDLLSLIQARVLWTAITIVFWFWIARKLLPGISLLPGWHTAAFRRSFRFGVWQTASSAGSVLAGQTDRFLLGVYVSTAAVGLYNIAYTVYITIYSAVYKLGEVLFPAISELQGSGQESRAVGLMLRSSWLLGTVTVVAMAPLVVFGQDVLRLYVGEEVAANMGQLLSILAVAGILSSGSVAVFQYILGTGRTQWMALITLATGLVILVGGIILIPRYGLNGAGWTQILAVVVSRPIILILLWRSVLRNEVALQRFLVYLYGPAVIGLTITLGLAYLQAQIAWTPGWIGLIVGAGLVALFVLIGIFGISRLLPDGRQRQGDAELLWHTLRSMAGRIATRASQLV